MPAERLTCIVPALQYGSFLSWQGLCYWKSFVAIYVLTRLKGFLHREGPRTKLETLKLGFQGDLESLGILDPGYRAAPARCLLSSDNSQAV